MIPRLAESTYPALPGPPALGTPPRGWKNPADEDRSPGPRGPGDLEAPPADPPLPPAAHPREAPRGHAPGREGARRGTPVRAPQPHAPRLVAFPRDGRAPGAAEERQGRAPEEEGAALGAPGVRAQGRGAARQGPAEGGA